MRSRSGIEFSDVVAATFVVGADLIEADFLTIQEALDNLPPEGGTLFVLEGSYLIAAAITLPDKPVRIIGAGIGATIFDLAGNAIPLFDTGLNAQDYSFSDFTVTASAVDADKRFLSVDASARINVDRVVGTNLRRVIVVTAGSPEFRMRASKFSLFDNAGSLFLAGTAGTILHAYDVEATGPNDRGGIAGGLVAELVGCFFSARNFVVLGTRSILEGTRLKGTDGEAVDFDTQSRASSCYFEAVTVNALGSDIEIANSIFDGSATQLRNLFSAAARLKVVGCLFRGCTADHVMVQSQDDAYIGCQFRDSAPVAQCIEITAASARIKIVGCGFESFSGEAVLITSANGCVITGNENCEVTEAGTANFNRYDNNTGFSPSTIIGADSVVNGAMKKGVTGGVTTAAFVTQFTHTNPKGVMGVGTIKNTGGVNELEVQETATDAFGVTDSKVTSIPAGTDAVLDSTQSITTARPPYTSYAVAVRHPVAATTFDLQFLNQGPVQT